MYKTGIYQFDTGLLNQYAIGEMTPPTAEMIKAEATAVITKPQPIPLVIDAPPSLAKSISLSSYLRKGCRYHPLCRQSFVDKVVTGFYHYERTTHYHTCAVAAAYVGAFGPDAVTTPEFSYSMAIWRLSLKLGFDLHQVKVIGPTGRKAVVGQEMMQLVDVNWWTREAVADWLDTIGL